jgi:hypothetical protein
MRVRSPMGANRALVAKCAPDGFRESLARSARIGRAHQPHVCRANPEAVFGPRGGCEEATSPRAVSSTQPSSRHRSAVHRQSAHWGFQLQRRVEHPDAPPGRSRQVSCTRPLSWEETASKRRRCECAAKSWGRSWPEKRHTRAMHAEAKLSYSWCNLCALLGKLKPFICN